MTLGRAIVRNPACFLMDEPLGALDAEFRDHMAGELRALHDRMRATTVYVTHDQMEAMQMGDKIVVMNHGVVEKFGKPQDIDDWPATTFGANFIGSPPMNFLRFGGMVGHGMTSIDMSDQAIEIAQMFDGATGALILGVRPENVHLDDEASTRGRILAGEYLGTTQIVTLDTARGQVKARIDSETSVRIDDTTGQRFDARSITLFDQRGPGASVHRQPKGAAPWLR